MPISRRLRFSPICFNNLRSTVPSLWYWQPVLMLLMQAVAVLLHQDGRRAGGEARGQGGSGHVHGKPVNSRQLFWLVSQPYFSCTAVPSRDVVLVAFLHTSTTSQLDAVDSWCSSERASAACGNACTRSLVSWIHVCLSL